MSEDSRQAGDSTFDIESEIFADVIFDALDRGGAFVDGRPSKGWPSMVDGSLNLIPVAEDILSWLAKRTPN